MKEKIKNIIKTIKEMSKNPRKKALLELGAWLLFFLISYIIIILIPHPTPTYKSSSNENKIDSLTKYSTRKSYEYEITFTYLDNEEKIIGTYFDNNYYFTYLEEEYYAPLETIYKVDNITQTLILDNSFLVTLSVLELSNDKVKEMIDSSKIVEEKEYKDGKRITTYECIKEEKNITLTFTESDSEIIEVIVDYSDYYELYPNLQVKLEYSEINNLTSYSKYLDYQVVEGE